MFDRFDWVVSLNRPWPFIFIGWSLYPWNVENTLKTDYNQLTTLIQTKLLKIGQTGYQNRSDRIYYGAQQIKPIIPVTTQTGKLSSAISPMSRLQIRRSVYPFWSSRKGHHLGALKLMIWPHLNAVLSHFLSHWWNRVQNIPKRSSCPA